MFPPWEARASRSGAGTREQGGDPALWGQRWTPAGPGAAETGPRGARPRRRRRPGFPDYPPRDRREPGIPQTQTLPGSSLPDRPPGPGRAGTPKRPTVKPGASKRPWGGPEPRPPPAPARQPAPRPPRAAWAASESPGHRRAEPSRAEPSERALQSRAEAGRAAQRSPAQPSAAQPGAAESRPPAGKQRAPAPPIPPRPGSREPGTAKRVSSPTGPQRGHPRERSGAWHSLTRPLCPEQPRSLPRLSGLSLPDKAGQGTPV
ncbi:proline-rich protein 2-like [Budorcas taxicolor]|uniref:proline-rich protein 2-like n=1 Tax=Budorcas taxicolor TaxID=37181 RepID=UPI0022846E9D|nr:proline-rich protein 2-like [Budorcas taxicolor]